MSYTPTTWKSGDIVSSVGLNKIENGIAASQEKITDTSKLSADLLSEGSTNKLVSEAEKTSWNNKSVVSIPETSTSDTAAKFIKIGDLEYKLATGEGKNWYNVSLGKEDVEKLVKGLQLTKKFDNNFEYDPASFKNDYFMCTIDQTANKDGNLVFAGEDFTKVFINLDGFSDIKAYMGKSLTDGFIKYGFDHNFYATLVLYAGCNSKEQTILEGPGIIDGRNVIYAQDVSQQQWEYNTDDGKSQTTHSRERLEDTIYGEAFVISVKGSDGSAAFAYILGKSQLAYWDTDTQTLKWANTNSGRFYKVTFDGNGVGEHGTLRWLAELDPEATEPGIWAKEIHIDTKSAWLNTGITFDTGKYAASEFHDTNLKSYTKCFGAGDKYLSKVFSFNKEFTDSGEAVHLDYIGRPLAYNLDTYIWYEYDEELQKDVKKIEKNGAYIWQALVGDVPVMLTVPDNEDDAGIPHRTHYILELDTSSLTRSMPLYRHSFKITSNDADLPNNEWAIRCTFQGMNTQLGDDYIGYILFSDESKQYPTPDWILPCYGKLGQKVDGTVSKWYDVIRVKATYTADPTAETDPGVRCLRFEYFDDNMDIQEVNVVTANNYGYYTGRDFRSSIGVFKAPQALMADVVEVSAE